MPDPSTSPPLNQTEAARALRVSVDTLRRWRKRGTGPVHVNLPMIGPRYRREAIDAFLACREAA